MTITAKQALEALEKFIHYTEKAHTAQHKAGLAGASITGDRYERTAINWYCKADKTLGIVREYLKEQVENYSR